MSGELVLVTGATGFIAGHIIQQLLMKGYRVRGTVKDIDSKEDLKHLIKLQNSKNLELLECDLTVAENWSARVSKDVTAVFHVASPYILLRENLEEIENKLIKPTIQGTKYLLDMCKAEKSIKKVCLFFIIIPFYIDTLFHNVLRLLILTSSLNYKLILSGCVDLLHWGTL